jgi:hypothetical protein
MWHNISGPTFHSINTESTNHTRITLNTVHTNGFQFLGKYSQPQNILSIKYTYQIKKGKVYPRAGHEDPLGVERYSFTVYPRCGGWTPRPGRKETQYPSYRRLGGPKAGLDRWGKSRPHRDSNPRPPTCSKSLYRLHCLGPHINIRRWVMPNGLISHMSTIWQAVTTVWFDFKRTFKNHYIEHNVGIIFR